ncbi:hypothetical protein GP486_005620 [Trichoglossum hirsutum]|uniref:SnoaL-like domain-containing protein n=1 Tax=Trichoglossum hirsutum TaxID=265104 RepID=A0A9P8L8X2_9PEZI|nr:hypothetical protein GP486_005620 [Trichoglossum hirsutum]
MAPTPKEIRDLFDKIYGVGANHPHELISNHVAKNAKVHIIGEEYKNVTDVHDLERLFAPVTGAIDKTKPRHTELVRVIGGGDDQWAALEFVSTGTNTNGKPYHHENCIILRFGEDGKVVEGKAYLDTYLVHGYISGKQS